MGHTLSKGDLLEGKYAIGRAVGEGGMGVVYEAEHVVLKMRVAIKVLHPSEAEHPETISRFKVEAQSAAAMRHPNIVEVTDFGLTPDGHPFFVMEFLRGESLADRMERVRQFPERETVETTDQILNALSKAHGMGVVHRDLKPENVFISKSEGSREVVKLLDFGIAKIIGGASPSTAVESGDGWDVVARGRANRPVTLAGTIFGTPGYIAPETISNRGVADHRSDLFAVGVMMYEMLTGSLPFDARDVPGMLEATVNHAVPRPRLIRPDISGAMERVVLTPLAKNPIDRYQSAEEFTRHLTAAAVGRVPEEARPCLTKVTSPSGAHPRVSMPSPVQRDQDATETQDIPLAPIPEREDRGVSYDAIAERQPQSLAPSAVGGETGKGAGLPRRRILIAAAALLVVVAGGFTAMRFLVGPGEEPSGDGEGSGRAKAQRLLGPDGEPIPEEVVVWVDVKPRGATLMWDGKLVSERPFVARGGIDPVAVEVSAPGYSTRRLEVVPDRERTIRVALEPEGAPSGGGAEDGGASSPDASP